MVLLLTVVTVNSAWADPTPPSWDEDRLECFAEHQQAGKVLDREREKGRALYDEEVERRNRARMKALAEHKKQIKEMSPQENGPEDLADRAAKKKVVEKKEKIRKDYIVMKAKMLAQKKSNVRIVSEAEELDLLNDRARYDTKRRVLYGAKNHLKGNLAGLSGGRGSSSGSDNNGFTPSSRPIDDGNMGGNYFPPPAPVGMEPDDGNAGDFAPPPVMPTFDEGNPPGEFPPPPPAPDFGEFPAPPPMSPFPPTQGP